MDRENQALDEFNQTVVARVKETFPEAIQEVTCFLGELTLVVDRAAIVEVATFLRDELRFNFMSDLSAVDMWPQHPRFEVNLHLLILNPDSRPGQGTRRLRLKVRLEEQAASMTTLTGVWPSAAWYEREMAELYGIDFEGHPDMRPLLLPEDWEGKPPMRRDVPVKVEEVAFSFNQDRIYAQKPFVKE